MDINLEPVIDDILKAKGDRDEVRNVLSHFLLSISVASATAAIQALTQVHEKIVNHLAEELGIGSIDNDNDNDKTADSADNKGK